MSPRRIDLSLLELAPVLVALDPPPGGGVWELGPAAREEGTGRAVVRQRVRAPRTGEEHELALSGPTLVGLGDAQLAEERARAERVRDAAARAIEAIDAHLALRRRPLWAAQLTREPEALTLTLDLRRDLHVYALSPDGALSVREFGGEVWHMGNLVSSPRSTVRAWRGAAPVALHRRVLAALAAAGFPDLPMEPMVPDELVSWIEIAHTDGARVSARFPQRLARRVPELAAALSDLIELGTKLRAEGPREEIPNPELRR